MTTREYIIDAVAQRTNEVPTADCATILWAIQATLDVVPKVIAKHYNDPLYDFDERIVLLGSPSMRP